MIIAEPEALANVPKLIVAEMASMKPGWIVTGLVVPRLLGRAGGVELDGRRCTGEAESDVAAQSAHVD